MNYLLFGIIIFLTYSISLLFIENVCFRINSHNITNFSIIPIFTEGLFGPIRSLYLLLKYDGILTFLYYVKYLLFSLHNVFGATVFVIYIYLLYTN
jgi:hypothetical protein